MVFEVMDKFVGAYAWFAATIWIDVLFNDWYRCDVMYLNVIIGIPHVYDNYWNMIMCDLKMWYSMMCF